MPRLKIGLVAATLCAALGLPLEQLWAEFRPASQSLTEFRNATLNALCLPTATELVERCERNPEGLAPQVSDHCADAEAIEFYCERQPEALPPEYARYCDPEPPAFCDQDPDKDAWIQHFPPVELGSLLRSVHAIQVNLTISFDGGSMGNVTFLQSGALTLQLLFVTSPDDHALPASQRAGPVLTSFSLESDRPISVGSEGTGFVEFRKVTMQLDPKSGLPVLSDPAGSRVLRVSPTGSLDVRDQGWKSLKQLRSTSFRVDDVLGGLVVLLASGPSMQLQAGVSITQESEASDGETTKHLLDVQIEGLLNRGKFNPAGDEANLQADYRVKYELEEGDGSVNLQTEMSATAELSADLDFKDPKGTIVSLPTLDLSTILEWAYRNESEKPSRQAEVVLQARSSAHGELEWRPFGSFKEGKGEVAERFRGERNNIKLLIDHDSWLEAHARAPVILPPGLHLDGAIGSGGEIAPPVIVRGFFGSLAGFRQGGIFEVVVNGTTTRSFEFPAEWQLGESAHLEPGASVSLEGQVVGWMNEDIVDGESMQVEASTEFAVRDLSIGGSGAGLEIPGSLRVGTALLGELSWGSYGRPEVKFGSLDIQAEFADGRSLLTWMGEQEENTARIFAGSRLHLKSGSARSLPDPGLIRMRGSRIEGEADFELSAGGTGSASVGVDLDYGIDLLDPSLRGPVPAEIEARIEVSASDDQNADKGREYSWEGFAFWDSLLQGEWHGIDQLLLGIVERLGRAFEGQMQTQPSVASDRPAVDEHAPDP